MAEEKLTFTKKVIAAQQALKAPKGQFNKFGNYSYRSAEDILEAAKPVNEDMGLLLTITDSIEQIGDRYYIKATATLTDGEESVSVTAYAREALTKKGMDDSQITGSASSYARKYALNGLYLIDDAKDADTNEYHNQAKNAPKDSQKEPSKAQQEKEYKDAVNGYYAKIRQIEPNMSNEQITSMVCQRAGVQDIKQIAPAQVIANLKTIYLEVDQFHKQQTQQQNPYNNPYQNPYGG